MKASRYNTIARDGETFLHHNTLYGGLLAAGARDHAAIEAVLRNPEQPWEGDRSAAPYFHLLQQNRFLVEDDLDEVELCCKIFNRSNENNQVLSVTVMLSYACNFSCGYCFQRLSRDRQGEAFLDENMFGRLCEFLRAKTEGIARLRMVWMGGEPLLHTEPVIRYAAKLRTALADRPLEIVHLIITNGYLLDPATLGALRASLEPVTFQITIDGPPAVHDAQRPLRSGAPTYATIVKNVEHCLKNDVAVVIRVNVDESNAPFLPKLFDLFDRSIISTRQNIVSLARTDHTVTANERVSPRDYKAFAATELEALLQCAHRPYVTKPTVRRVSGCPGLGEREFMVDGGGHVFRCPRYMEDNAYAVGSLAAETAVLGPSAEDWRTWTPLAQRKCRSCALLPVCMGGCPFRSIAGTGDNICGETPYLYKTRLIRQHRSRAVGIA